MRNILDAELGRDGEIDDPRERCMEKILLGCEFSIRNCPPGKLIVYSDRQKAVELVDFYGNFETMLMTSNDCHMTYLSFVRTESHGHRDG